MGLAWNVVLLLHIVISSAALWLPHLVNGKATPVSLLLEFKKSSVEKDPLGVLAKWKPPQSQSPCSWRGITCSPQGEVLIVDLSHSGLVGSLHLRHLTAIPTLHRLSLNANSFSAGNLSAGPNCSAALESLDLSSNAIANAIEADLSSCTALANLNLSRNLIASAAPTRASKGGSLIIIPPSMRQLDISHNHISDWNAISSSIATTCKDNGTLALLNVSSNHLAGDLDTLSSCHALLTLDLSNNAFQGSVQPDFPASLQYLDLSFNNFTALSFGSTVCTNLTTLMLSSAFLPLSDSQSPLTLSSTCRLLQKLDLSHNQLLSIGLPSTLFNLHLNHLSLAHNNLSSQIPPQLAQQLCPTLQQLDLSYNNFSGGLPVVFASCSSLITLNLANNQLSGDFLNTVVSKMQSLRYLYLAFNNITGSVPLSLSRLRVLDLSSNAFTGSIPPGFCPASSTLEKIMMASNYLSGSVLTELEKCKSLKTIDLSFNNLSGPIPEEIWKLPNLSDLIMWANNLNGEIPQGICTGGAGNLRMLILNNNLLRGTIPHSISSCTNMVWLSFSSNRLIGHIPSGISALASLAILQLGNNMLSGSIPAELGRCRSLAWLELNNNNLSGRIPMELADQSGLVMPSIVMSGMKYGFLRYQGGAGCKGGGGLIEIDGIRNERLYTLPMVVSCSFTRIYTGRAVYSYASNGTMIYLGLADNTLSGNIPDKIGSMTYLQMLNLAHNNLTGIIPNTFGGLISMSILDLSRNHLEGSIPRSMSMLTSLIELDMSNNNLSGPIPSGGQLITFSASSYANNSLLCGVPLPPCRSFSTQTGSDSGEEERKWSIAVGIAVGGAFSLVCIMAMIVVLLWMMKKKQHEEELQLQKEMESLPPTFDGWKLSSGGDPLSINLAAFAMPLRKLTFGHLVEATGGFSEESMIGSGGFGDVYKAQLNDGSMVAVKKLIKVTGQGDREFMAEMETIGKIKHRNLVPLLGYCKFGDERILVYEYMKWGSLDFMLHDPDRVGHLGWEARRNIAVGSARGLAFLHHSCIPHIIHRDMKSSNVLLDERLEARLSDFGMARLVNAVDTHLSVSTLAGTPGYVPPEYYQSFKCTAKGDVYSYGVVLLELLSGRKPIDPSQYGDDTNVVGWAKKLHREGRSMDILDGALEREHHAEISHFLEIALECLDERPMRRPTMIQVMTKFKDKMSVAAGGGDCCSNSISHSSSTTSDVMDGFSL